MDFKSKKFKKIVVPLFLFVVVFGLYLYTSPRHQTGYADSEELMAATYVWGVPHPPGYPLFPLLSRPFLLIPFGSVAFKFSIFSSLFGSLSVVLIFFILLKILEKEEKENWFFPLIGALTGSFCLAFSYTFWLFSIIPEVFCLSNFFACLLMLIGICWYEDKKKPRAKYYPYLLAFVFALAFLAHQILIFLIIPFLYLAWKLDRDLFFPSKRWFFIVGALFLGFLPLVYLPIAAANNPPLDFGNPTSIPRLWRHFTRAVYRKGSKTASAYLPSSLGLQERIEALFIFTRYLVREFTVIPCVVGALGGLFLLKKKKSWSTFLFLCFLFMGYFWAFWGGWGKNEASLSFNQLGARERVAITGYITFSLLIGFGVFYFLKFAKKLEFSRISLGVFAFLLFILPLYPLRDNFGVVNKRDFTLGRDFAEDLFRTVEQDGILILKGDRPTFSAYYYQMVEGKRKDVTLLSAGAEEWDIRRWKEEEPDLFDTENTYLLAVFRDMIQKNIGERRIYTTGLRRDTSIQLGIADNPFTLSPHGLISEITYDFDLGEEDWQEVAESGLPRMKDYYDWYARELVEQYLIGLSNNYFHYRSRGYYDPAKRQYEEMLEIGPENEMTQKVANNLSNFNPEKQKPEDFRAKTAEEHFDSAREYLKSGKTASAMSEYWAATYLEPENTVYRLQLGGAYESLGWHKEAYNQYKKILEIEEEDELVLEKTRERIEVVREKIREN